MAVLRDGLASVCHFHSKRLVGWCKGHITPGVLFATNKMPVWLTLAKTMLLPSVHCVDRPLK